MHNCTNVTVPRHLFCYEKPEDPGYEIGCVQECPADCMMDMTPTPVCATDFGVYEHPCEMAKEVCNMYAKQFLDAGDIVAAGDAIDGIKVEENSFCEGKNVMLYVDFNGEYI